MFSLQTRVKLYILFSMIVYIIMGVSLFLIEMKMTPVIQQAEASSEISGFLNSVYIFMVVVAVLALFNGGYVLIFSFTRGVNKYKDIARRLSSVENSGGYNLSSLEFPKEDEFGNLGSELNSIVSHLKKFDELKVQRLKIERQKFQLMADHLSIPVLVVSIEKNEKKITYYNSKFREIFARKGEENIFYDIKNAFLSALNIQSGRDAEEEPNDEKMNRFVDEEFVHSIDLACTSRTPITIKKDIPNMRGDTIYHSDSVEITPLWNENGETLQVIILFEKLKKK